MDTRNKKYLSAIDRLRELPEIFHGSAAIARFRWTSKTGSQYFYKWAAAGLILPFGGHSDVFANLVANPKPNTGAMCRLAMPGAVIVGIDALRRAGWTTQIQRSPEVAVPAWQPVYKTPFYTPSPRPASWFAAVKYGISEEQEVLPTLQPELALVDLLKRDGWAGCSLDPDDIDWPDEPFTGKRWEKACQTFGVEPNTFNPDAHDMSFDMSM